MFRQFLKLRASLPKVSSSLRTSRNLPGTALMSTYRDLSIPYTAQEIEELKKVVRTLPTYKDGSVSSKDLPEMMKKWNWDRTPEQVQGYIDFFDTMYGGRLTLDMIERNLRSFHNTSLLAREQFLNLDKDHDGFIDQAEFGGVLQCMQAHDPKLKAKTWEQFLEEADTNKDGRVSVGECTEWIAKYI